MYSSYGLFVVVLLVLVIYNLGYVYCFPDSEIAITFKKFRKHPSWQTFKDALAARASDIWNQFILWLILVSFPVPGSANYLYQRFIDGFIGLGILYVAQIIILGMPSWKVQSNAKSIPGSLFALTVLVLGVGSYCQNLNK